MKIPHSLPVAQDLFEGDSRGKDLAFLAAWEDGNLPRSIDAATILRVRQIMRAKAENAVSERK